MTPGPIKKRPPVSAELSVFDELKLRKQKEQDLKRLCGRYRPCLRVNHGEKCGRPGLFQPVIHIPQADPNPDGIEAHYTLDVPICSVCKDYTSFDDLVPPDGKEVIKQEAAKHGVAELDFSKATTQWKRLA